MSTSFGPKEEGFAGGKLSAEQDAGERTHERPIFVPRVDIYETETGLSSLRICPA